MSLLAGNSQQRCLLASLLFRYRVRIFSYCWEQQPTAYSSISSVVDFVSHCWGQQLTICSGIASVVGFLFQVFFKLPTTCLCNCNQRCCVGCVIFIIGCNIQEVFQVFRGDIVALFFLSLLGKTLFIHSHTRVRILIVDPCLHSGSGGCYGWRGRVRLRRGTCWE